MVACPPYNNFNINRVTPDPGKHCACPVYLYLILSVMKRSEVLETILAFMVMLGIIYWLTKTPWWLLAAAVLAVIGLLFKKLAKQIYLLWERLSHVIGSIMNKVILTLVFIFILIPLSWLSKLFKKRAVNASAGNSYFSVRNTTYSKENLENIW